MDMRLSDLLIPCCEKLFEYKTFPLAPSDHPHKRYPERMIVQCPDFLVRSTDTVVVVRTYQLPVQLLQKQIKAYISVLLTHFFSFALNSFFFSR